MPPIDAPRAAPAPHGATRPAGFWSRLRPCLPLLPLAFFAAALLGTIVLERHVDRRSDLLRNAASLQAAVEAELNAGLRSLEALTTSEHLSNGDLSGFRREAQRLLAHERGWFTIALTDGERQLFNLRFPAEAALPALADLAAISSVLRTGRAAPGGLFEGRYALRVPVRIDGAVRFVVVATLDAAGLSAPLDRANLPPGWSAMLLDREGRQLAQAAASALDAEALRPLVNRVGQPVPAVGTLALALPVAEERWTLLVATPREGILDQALPWLLAALGVVALLGGLLLARRGRPAPPLAPVTEVGDAALGDEERRRNDLLATVSHELRAPLSGLLGYTDMLAGADLPATARVWVEQQRRAGQTLLALIGDVLDYARLEEGAVVLEDTDLDVSALLEDCAGLLRAVAERKGLALRVASDPGLPRWIRGDPLRLRQVATNLLSNAIKFTERGEIVLSARLTPRPEQVEIAVSDTGIGIPEAELPRVFERFHQAAPSTARRFGGSGLGLAICRRLVEAMQGSIRAESRLGQGSRFVVRIPFRPGAAPSRRDRPAGLRILLAEDMQASRLLIQSVLERAGHTVLAAENGPAALAALHGSAFDMVVLDIHMPGLEGTGVARAVRELGGEQGRVPIIALTADAAPQVEDACRAAGFDAVLHKPFETRRLLGLVDALRVRVSEETRG